MTSYLTSTGLNAPTEFQIRQDLQDRYEGILGQSVDWSPDTFEGAFSSAVARALASTSDTTQELWDNLSLERASGAALEVFGALVQREREPAQASSVLLNLTGDSGTIVPVGSVVADEDNNRWELTEAVTIPGSGVAVSQEVGPVEAPAGTLTEVVTPISGWDAVTNPDPADIGRNRESDALYRERIRAARAGGRPSSFRGIQSTIRELPFVQSSLVVHNPTSSPATVQGIALNANSYSVIVFPDTIPVAAQDTLFETIFENGPVGIETIGSESKYIEGWPVRFSFATEAAVDVTVVVTIDDAFESAEVLEDAERQIISYINSLDVGGSVRLLPLYGALNLIDGVLTVESLLIDGTASDRAVNADEFARPDTVNASEL